MSSDRAALPELRLALVEDAIDLDDGAADVESSSEHVEVAHAEADGFAPSQAGVREHHDEGGSGRVSDRAGEAHDLDVGQVSAVSLPRLLREVLGAARGVAVDAAVALRVVENPGEYPDGAEHARRGQRAPVLPPAEALAWALPAPSWVIHASTSDAFKSTTGTRPHFGRT